MNKALENYECEGQTEIFEFIEPPEGTKCLSCRFYKDTRWRIKAGEPPVMICVLKEPKYNRNFRRVDVCNDYMPDDNKFKCCHTCKYVNTFSLNNCELAEAGEETPNRKHIEGMPYKIDKSDDFLYFDCHEWDICDRYKAAHRYKEQELL